MEFIADDGDGDEDCLPVSTMEFGGAPGSSMGFRVQRYSNSYTCWLWMITVFFSRYFDIVIGVNPSHFIPPETCPRR